MLQPSQVAYVVLAPLFSFCGLALNVFTIAVLKFKVKRDATTAAFILNICLCDIFIVIVANPLYLYNVVAGEYAWIFGPAMCKLYKFVTMSTNTAQTFFLALISYDITRRSLNAAKFKKWSTRKNVLVITAIWVVSFGLCSGRLVQFKEIIMIKNGSIANVKCKPWGIEPKAGAVYTGTMFFVAYFLPLCVCVYNGIKMITASRHTNKVASTNIKARNKSLAIVLNVITLIFLLIWTPFFVLSVIDLEYALTKMATLVDFNFSFRCSILLFGSLKPIVYFAALSTFRSDGRRICRSIMTSPFCRVLCKTGPLMEADDSKTRIGDSSSRGPSSAETKSTLA